MKRLAAVLLLFAALAGVGGYGATYAPVQGKPRDPAGARDMPRYRGAVKRVLPAVVSIEAGPRAATDGARLPPSLHEHLKPLGRQPLPDFGSGRAFGSGFVADPSGAILTNAHVVRDAEELEVHCQDGRTFTTRDFKTDPGSGLAVVRIPVKEALPSLRPGDSDAMEVGDRVLAVGAPLGLTGTVTSGIISARDRDVCRGADEDSLQTDAAIGPGNSGGALVNLAGEVIGINAAVESRTVSVPGIGLAISSNRAKGVMGHLLRDGAAHRGPLGARVQPPKPDVASELGLAGTPTATAGQRGGDIVTEVAGQPVKDPRGLRRIVARRPAGQSVELGAYSEGVPDPLKRAVEEQPQSLGCGAESAVRGSRHCRSNLGRP
jgi:serine protease Do